MHDLTILIPINQGISYRYILQTDIFKGIQSKAKKIIILVPEPTDPFYENIQLYNNTMVNFRIYYFFNPSKSFCTIWKIF